MVVYKIMNKEGLYASPSSYQRVTFNINGKVFTRVGLRKHLGERRSPEYQDCIAVEFELVKVKEIQLGDV